MIILLAKWLIPDRENITSPKVRQAYGTLCGGVGIVLNLLLFICKFFAGVLSGSIAVTADAFNNLSDAGSSLITLIGFRLAGKKPDPGHPFGHGRLEYLSGLMVSIAILLMGYELGRSSIGKIITPDTVVFSPLALMILLTSIFVKLYMAYYNKKIGKRIKSSAMRATATDSLSDCLATSVALVSMLVSKWTGLQVDGYGGALVALFILYSGVNAAKETIAPLLGEAPDPELVVQIESLVLSHKDIMGVHDLVVHDYGPGRLMITLHAEVPANADMIATHDVIDNIECDLSDQLGCHAVIHMDPVETDNIAVMSAREQVALLVCELDPALSIHDFRMVSGPTHVNIIFDVVSPFSFRLTDEQLKSQLREMIKKAYPTYKPIITVDKNYTQ